MADQVWMAGVAEAEAAADTVLGVVDRAGMVGWLAPDPVDVLRLRGDLRVLVRCAVERGMVHLADDRSAVAVWLDPPADGRLVPDLRGLRRGQVDDVACGRRVMTGSHIVARQQGRRALVSRRSSTTGCGAQPARSGTTMTCPLSRQPPLDERASDRVVRSGAAIEAHNSEGAGPLARTGVRMAHRARATSGRREPAGAGSGAYRRAAASRGLACPGATGRGGAR
nr:hypothetical protein GCM10020063_009850 [Dactylosporangium thailandense]